ncbi:histidine phosphatase family protein [Sulfurimonas sp.]|uniref:histidine phosphatase family protein n=1 Tax=Sulfurimonas sp. TaxID=2022749 RepID=UPI0035660FF8
MRVTLLRHCEVDEKYLGCYNGHIDIGLSKKGYEQAEVLAKKLKNENYDGVFCSDLLRAKESIKYFQNLENIFYTDKLREKSWGVDEGKKYDQICQEKNITYESFEQWIDALGGESVEEFSARVKNFFFDYLSSSNYENVLVITHSGVIKTFFSLLNKTSLEKAFSQKVEYAFCETIEF